MRLIDADALKKNMEFICMGIMAGTEPYNAPLTEIDNAETYNQVGHRMATAEGFCTNQLDCDNCEGKAFSYSMGLKDGYLLGGFQLTELRRWLIAQGYSEGTVNDKIEDFQRFVKRVREDEG